MLERYMKDVYAYAKKKHIFDYDELYQATPEYHNYFINSTGNMDKKSFMQATTAVTDIMIKKGVLEKLMGEDGIMFKSKVVSEEDAIKEGELEIGEELAL